MLTEYWPLLIMPVAGLLIAGAVAIRIYWPRHGHHLPPAE